MTTSDRPPHTAADLDPAARARLDALVGVVTAEPRRVAVVFPAVAREVARGAGPSEDPDGVLGPTLEDVARVELVRALRGVLPADRLAGEVDALYRFGDAEEKRAVLRGLPLLGAGATDVAARLISDALRSNDARLIAAALGTAAADTLDDHAWRHGVLKCLFSGVPLAAVAGLERRADAELARMAGDLAVERIAAGRDVPPDTWPLLTPHPEAVAAVSAYLEAAHPDQRAAAERALAARDAADDPSTAPDAPEA